MVPIELQESEQPIYVLLQDLKRALVPKIISLLFLGILFYLGVLLNLSLLDLNAPEETTFKMISLVILLIIVGTGVFFSFCKAQQKCIFYHNQIVFGKKEIFYNNILSVKRKHNFLDKMFKTYSLDLSADFGLKHISEQVDMEDYVRKLVDYAKKRVNV